MRDFISSDKCLIRSDARCFEVPQPNMAKSASSINSNTVFSELLLKIPNLEISPLESLIVCASDHA